MFGRLRGCLAARVFVVFFGGEELAKQMVA